MKKTLTNLLKLGTVSLASLLPMQNVEAQSTQSSPRWACGHNHCMVHNGLHGFASVTLEGALDVLPKMSQRDILLFSGASGALAYGVGDLIGMSSKERLILGGGIAALSYSIGFLPEISNRARLGISAGLLPITQEIYDWIHWSGAGKVNWEEHLNDAMNYQVVFASHFFKKGIKEDRWEDIAKAAVTLGVVSGHLYWRDNKEFLHKKPTTFLKSRFAPFAFVGAGMATAELFDINNGASCAYILGNSALTIPEIFKLALDKDGDWVKVVSGLMPAIYLLNNSEKKKEEKTALEKRRFYDKITFNVNPYLDGVEAELKYTF